jgi:hypothetical protein
MLATSCALAAAWPTVIARIVACALPDSAVPPTVIARTAIVHMAIAHTATAGIGVATKLTGTSGLHRPTTCKSLA